MISVIIPVYNSEAYLPEAVESVLAQTYQDWELILVDDGSEDNSGKLCEILARRTPRIKVIHRKNGGQSSARNTGLKYAGGEFITFLDADDILSPSALESLLNAASSSNADITCGKIYDFISINKLLRSSKYIESIYPNGKYTHILTPGKALDRILYQQDLDNSACGKLYAASIWKDLRFREGTGYEDLDIIYQAVMKAKRIATIKAPVYFYRQHEDSYIHTFNLRRTDVLEVTQRLSDFMSMNCPQHLRAAHSRQLSANFNMLGLIAANIQQLQDNPDEYRKAQEIATQCWEKIKELRGESLRNPSVRLKNKIGIVLSYLTGRRGVETIAIRFYR